MTDHLSFDQLCDVADAALPSAAESAARAHLRSCDDCTARLSAAVDAPYLIAIPRVTVYVALFAWALTALGLVLTLGSTLRQRPAE